MVYIKEGLDVVKSKFIHEAVKYGAFFKSMDMDDEFLYIFITVPRNSFIKDDSGNELASDRLGRYIGDMARYYFTDMIYNNKQVPLQTKVIFIIKDYDWTISDNMSDDYNTLKQRKLTT